MERKKRIKFVGAYLLIGSIILFTIMGIVDKKNNKDYRAISLQNINASVPREFVDDDASFLDIKDYMFYLGTENSEYSIIGIQLPADEDVEKILNKDSLNALMTANTGGRVLEAIQSGTGLFLNNCTQGCISKPSYTMYYYSSEEMMNGKKYQAYVLFLVEGDTRYLQINLFDEDHVITEKQMKHMRLFTTAIR